MCDAQESGRCDVCGEQGILLRKYYHYDVECDCCSGDDHFEIVRYHKNNCKPRPPAKVRIIRDMRPKAE